MAEEEKTEKTEKTGKTPAEKLQDVVSQLKEMEHYSKSNVEKLTEFWLLFEDEIKDKDLAGKMDDLLACQNKFHELVQSVIEACEEKSGAKNE